MPPKVKYEKSQIIDAAVQLVRESGFENLTARRLAGKLGCSVCPIFTVFKSMEEVADGTMAAIRRIYDGYVAEGLKSKPAFKGVGQQYIAFAASEPKLFETLFMRKQADIPYDKILASIEDNYNAILQSIEDEYGLDEAKSKQLYLHMWIYTHGIAALCVSGMCSFRAEEMGDMLTQCFKGMIKEIAGEEK